MRETWVQSLGREDPLEKEMATHPSTLAWRIPWVEEPGGLQSTGSQRVGHNWATSLLLFNLLSLLQQITHSCIICSSVSPQGALKPVPSCPTHEAPGHIPGEDWQIDFHSRASKMKTKTHAHSSRHFFRVDWGFSYEIRNCLRGDSFSYKKSSLALASHSLSNPIISQLLSPKSFNK